MFNYFKNMQKNTQKYILYIYILIFQFFIIDFFLE